MTLYTDKKNNISKNTLRFGFVGHQSDARTPDGHHHHHHHHHPPSHSSIKQFKPDDNIMLDTLSIPMTCSNP